MASEGLQRARAGQSVSDETVANYTAARLFLMGEWLGASMAVASFTLLYLLTYGTNASTTVILAVCVAMMAAGGYIFLSNHRYYVRLDFPWAKKWDIAAMLLAGSAAIFWLLFILLEVLTLLGVRVGPPS